MSEILQIDDDKVKIGQDNGEMVEMPIASLRFTNPVVGDQVKVYKDAKSYIVKRVEEESSVAESDTRRVNKIAYVLLVFFLGGLGVHRFMRGQVGLGVLMLLITILIGPITFGFAWLAVGVWVLVDFIISLVKLSDYKGDNFEFTAGGRWTTG